MKKLFYEKWQTGRQVEINMSPLIDCIFLLLIFFIVTSVFVKEAGVEIQRPQAVSSKEIDRHSIQFGLSAEGKLFYDRKQIAVNRVQGIIGRRYKTGQTVPVIVIADKACPSGKLIDVVDECKLAGAQQVSVATERE